MTAILGCRASRHTARGRRGRRAADSLLVFADRVDQTLRDSIEVTLTGVVSPRPGAVPRLVLVVNEMAELHLWWVVGAGPVRRAPAQYDELGRRDQRPRQGPWAGTSCP